MKSLIKRELATKITFITVVGAIIISLLSIPILYGIFSNENIINTLQTFLKNIHSHPFYFAILFSFIIFLLSLIPIVMTYFLIKIEIISPLKQVINQMENIASGDLEKEIKVTREDEIGTLQDSFERMRISLKVLIEKLEKEIG